MPPTAAGNRRKLTMIPEMQMGVWPTVSASYPMVEMRDTGSQGVDHTRDELPNDEWTSDRSITEQRFGNDHLKIALPFQLSWATYDELMAAGLYGAWHHFNTLIPDLALTSVTIGAGTLTCATGNFTNYFRAGDWVYLSGSVGKDGYYLISALTSTILTLTGLTSDAATSVNVRLWKAKDPYALAVSGLTTAVAGQITRATGSWVTDGLTVGDTIVLSGMAVTANNNTPMVVTAVTALVLTITGFSADTAVSGRVRQVQYLRDSVYARPSSWEEQFTNLQTPVYSQASGFVPGMFKLSFQPGKKLSGSFDMTGTKFVANAAATKATTLTAKNTNPVFDTFTGSVLEAGGAVVLSALDLAVDNSPEAHFSLFDRGAFESIPGDSKVVANVGIYFRDKSLLDKWTGEVESSLLFSAVDLNANTYRWNLPRTKYGAPSKNVSKTQIIHTFPAKCLKDPTLGCHVIVEKWPA